MKQPSNIIPFPGRQRTAAYGVELMRRIDARMQAMKEAPAKGSEDRVYNYISRHHEAIQQGDAKDAEFFMRCLMMGAETRKGYIALARYLSSQMTANEQGYGGLAPTDRINGRCWMQSFLDHLAKDLRRMGSEFPSGKSRRAKQRPPA